MPASRVGVTGKVVDRALAALASGIIMRHAATVPVPPAAALAMDPGPPVATLPASSPQEVAATLMDTGCTTTVAPVKSGQRLWLQSYAHSSGSGLH